MKQLTKSKKIIIAIIAILMIIATIVVLTIGFNVELKFQDSKKIELYLEKEFEVSDIKQITDEVLQGQKVIIQKVEVYEDMVSITAKEITDEQKNEIINKVNEKYGTSLTTDEIAIVTVPQLHLREMLKKYISPFAMATAIILLYMAIRYYKLGIIKVVIQTILSSIIAQLVLFSIIAITRIPVGRLTIPMVITVFILALVALTTTYEKKLDKVREENKRDKKDRS